MKNIATLINLICLMSYPVYANSRTDALQQLMDMSLEELGMLEVEVQTVAKTAQKLSDIPASVYVLSGERIARSGVRTIPEALKLVPGLRVSKFSETEWYVSARGFHGGLYNKLLVLIDGRTVYSPVYGGVYWPGIDYLLADIDRIEVLRGPSGSIWGGNAVNGVVNIITKRAESTLSSLVEGNYSNKQDYELGLRQGFSISEETQGRVFYKQKSNRSDLSYDSETWLNQTGGVLFAHSGENRDITFRAGANQYGYQRDWYYWNGSQWGPKELDVRATSAFGQLQYAQYLVEGVKWESSLWFDYNEDNAKDAPGKYTTIDLDTNYFDYSDSETQWQVGAGARFIKLDFSGAQLSEWDENNVDILYRVYDVRRAHEQIFNAYGQIDKQWSENFSTTLGVKAEYFSQTSALEISPQLRAMYSFSESQQIWAGVGRAVVAPSYIDSNSYFVYYDATPKQVVVYPSDQLKTESVVSYELGYRIAYHPQLSLDMTAYYSLHDNVVMVDSFDAGDMINVFTTDDYQGTSHGVELAAEWCVRGDTRVYAAYSYLHLNLDWQGGDYSNVASALWASIEQQHLLSLQLLWDINKQLQWDSTIYYQHWENKNISLDDVVTLDMRLSWQYAPSYPKVEAVVQNLGGVGSADDLNTLSRFKSEQIHYLRLSYEF